MGGGGKGGGGGQRTPQVAPISLESAQRLKIVDLICEGVKDLSHPISAKDVFLDGTPLQNSDGSYNFEGVEIYGLPGTPDQDYLPGFETSDTIISVGTEVKQSQPVTRTVTDPLVDRVRVTIGLGGLEQIKDNGDTVERSVTLNVRAQKGAYFVDKELTIKGRTNSAYHRDVVLDNLPDVPFNLTVTRITEDSTDNRIKDNTTWVSYVESIDAKLNYPNSVVVGLKIDSNLFGGRVPRRTYRSHWQLVDVPTNYNPDARTYDGTWNGSFKTAWTNNPAWIYRDLVTNERYGLARFRDDIKVDKWSLYAIARYCDELVDDGNGGQEPRFVCNAYLTKPRDAYDVLSDLASCFRGITYFDGTQQIAVQDTARDPVAVYTNANVVDGVFEYAGVSYKDITTACIVKFADEDNSYQTDSVQYQDDDAIERFGYNVKTMTGFGVTSRGQAQRVAKWFVETSLRERETVKFSVGLEGIRHNPYDIIKIADNDYAGTQLGARVERVSGARVTLDREVTDVDKLHYLDNTGKERYRTVNAISGSTLTLSSAPTGMVDNSVVALAKTDVAPRLFRAITVTENDDGTYTINAVTHDAQKEAVVDDGAQRVDDTAGTQYGPQVFSGRVEKNGRYLKLKWDVIATNAVSYEIKLYRNGALYKTYYSDKPEIDISNLPLGDYRAEIRARDANGKLSDPIEQTWSLNYDITALRTESKFFAIDLKWQVPDNVINDAWIEIWYNTQDDITTAQRLARLTYPTSQYTLNNVELSDQFYFWARMVDSVGNKGGWTQSVLGQPSTDADGIVETLNGQLTQSQLSQELISQLVTNSELETETNQLTQAIQQAARQQADALNQKASELGTQISSVEDIASNNASQISTITAETDGLTAGLEQESQARIDGDAAEAQARQTLVSRVNNNESAITSTISTLSDYQSSTATQINNLSSQVSQLSDGGNLFISANRESGKYVYDNDGSLLNHGLHTASDFIPVESGETYKLIPKNGVLRFPRMVFYTLDGTYITGYLGERNDSSMVKTAPANAAKMRVSAEWELAGNGFALYKGTDKDEWLPSNADVTVAYGELNSSISQNSIAITDIKGKAQATHTIKTEAIAGGRTALAGISLGALANETTAESSVIIMADKFGVVKNAGDGSVKPMFSVINNKTAINGDLIANGTILGKHIKANQSLTSPYITGGWLAIGPGGAQGYPFTVNSAGKLAASNANITGHINATSGTFKGRIEANDGYFAGTVYANKLSGNVTEVFDFHRISPRNYDNGEMVGRLDFGVKDFPRIYLLYGEYSYYTTEPSGLGTRPVSIRVYRRINDSGSYILGTNLGSVGAIPTIPANQRLVLYIHQLNMEWNGRASAIVYNK